MTALGRLEREREGEQRYRNEEAKIPINREVRVRTASGQKEKTDAGSRKKRKGRRRASCSLLSAIPLHIFASFLRSPPSLRPNLPLLPLFPPCFSYPGAH